MAAVFDPRPTEGELEDLWRLFHTGWVRAHEAFLQAERHAHELRDRARQGRGRGLSEADLALLRMLHHQERLQRRMLEQFEHRMRELRSRTTALRRVHF